MGDLRRRAEHIRAAVRSERDARARYEQVRAKRSLRWWSDPDGTFRLDGRLTPDAGALLIAEIEPEARPVSYTHLDVYKRQVQVSLSLSPIRNEDGQICGTAAVGRDLSEADRLIDELRDSEARYRSIVESAQEGIALISVEGTFSFANHRMGELLGVPAGELIGTSAFNLVDLGSAPAAGGRLAGRRSRKAGNYEVCSVCPDGSMVRLLISAAPQFDPDGAYTGSLCMASDLSGLRRVEEELAHLTLHDPLTGLPNRALLYDRIDHALIRRPLPPPSVALLFCDLDGFKGVNDSFGRQVGNQVLQIVGERLVAAAGQSDTVARLDGDEFLVLTEDVYKRQLQVSEDTIGRMVRRGVLPRVPHVGGKVLIPKRALERLIEAPELAQVAPVAEDRAEDRPAPEAVDPRSSRSISSAAS